MLSFTYLQLISTCSNNDIVGLFLFNNAVDNLIYTKNSCASNKEYELIEG